MYSLYYRIKWSRMYRQFKKAYRFLEVNIFLFNFIFEYPKINIFEFLSFENPFFKDDWNLDLSVSINFKFFFFNIKLSELIFLSSRFCQADLVFFSIIWNQSLNLTSKFLQSDYYWTFFEKYNLTLIKVKTS